MVSRADAAYEAQVRKYAPGAKLQESDFQQAADAVDAIIDGVAVIETLGRFGRKVGLPEFDVGKLLRDYVGDVQTVTEFPYHRSKILYRFHAVLNGIVAAFRGEFQKLPEIYIVAHSEGTVISLLALLQALSDMRIPDPDNLQQSEGGAWVACVRGLMTIGSPIDKHIALWPGLWREYAFKTTVDKWVEVQSSLPNAAPVRLPQQIKWRNYFDYGDPVGFRLDEARRTLEQEMGCGVFEFETDLHDHGFSRYWFPGKAHVDYWKDSDLFRHFIDTAVQSAPGPGLRPPPNRVLRHHVAKCLPYLLAFAAHYAAVLVLLTGTGLLGTSADYADGVLGPLSLATLLAGVTVATRLPRLARPGLRWIVLAAPCLALGAFGLYALPERLAGPVLGVYEALSAATNPSPVEAGRHLLVVLACAVGAVSWMLPRRYGLRSRKFLVGSSMAVLVLVAILCRQGLAGIGLAHAAAWLAFSLLWALGIIVFDLAFVWHRYIRRSVCVRTLRAWCRHQDPDPDPYWGLANDPHQKAIDRQQQP